MSGNLTIGVLRTLAKEGRDVPATDFLWLCDELERLRASGPRSFFVWPSFTDWNIRCELILPTDPDDRDFEYALGVLKIAREAWALHQSKRAAVGAPAPAERPPE